MVALAPAIRVGQRGARHMLCGAKRIIRRPVLHWCVPGVIVSGVHHVEAGGGRHRKPAGRLDGPADRFTHVKGRILMRKPFRAGGVAVGALAVALTAGAFAFAPASPAATTATSSGVPASIRPGTPMKAVGTGSAAAASTINAVNSVTSVRSSNWAGYAASFRTTTFRFVSAQFTMPSVDCTGVTAASGAWSAHWVGLDGYRANSFTVEQIGVIAR